jgi:hypothetical protein
MAPSRSRDLPRERLFARLVPTLIEPRNCSTIQSVTYRNTQRIAQNGPVCAIL